MNLRKISLLSLAALPTGALFAATTYWDTNSDTAGAGTIADGTWDAATSNWTSDATGASTTTTYTSGDDVVFAAGSDATSGTITVSGTQLTNSITIEEGDFTFTGGLLDDTGAGYLNFTVLDGASAVFDQTDGAFNSNFDIQGSATMHINVVRGGSNMSKTGTGTLTVNRLDAILVVDEGTLVYTGSGTGASAKLKNTTINDGGTLRLEGNAFDGAKRNVEVNTGGTFELDGVDQTISFFTGGGSVVGENGAVLRIGGDNKSTTFSGSVSGDLDLYAIGTGTFTLADTSSVTFTIGANGVNNFIDGTGNININGEFVFDLTGADLTVGNQWLIVNIASLNETFGGTFSIAGFTETDNIWSNGSNLSFSEATGYLSVVPEPGAFAFLIGAASIGFVMARRRR